MDAVGRPGLSPDVADAYERGRPEYPPGRGARRSGCAAATRVLDLAAGTGKLSRGAARGGRRRRRGRAAAGDAPLRLPGRAGGHGGGDPAAGRERRRGGVGDAWHWFDQARAGAELARVVRPGGVAAHPLAAPVAARARPAWAQAMHDALREVRGRHPVLRAARPAAARSGPASPAREPHVVRFATSTTPRACSPTSRRSPTSTRSAPRTRPPARRTARGAAGRAAAPALRDARSRQPAARLSAACEVRGQRRAQVERPRRSPGGRRPAARRAGTGARGRGSPARAVLAGRRRRDGRWPARCTRIWWVRPVSSRTRSSVVRGQRALDLEVRDGLARACRCRSTGACARGGRGRSARRSCRCARAGGPRRARGTRA